MEENTSKRKKVKNKPPVPEDKQPILVRYKIGPENTNLLTNYQQTEPDKNTDRRKQMDSRNETIKRSYMRDAAHSAYIDVDGFGHMISVLLTDDIRGTYINFGQENGVTLPICPKSRNRAKSSSIYYPTPDTYLPPLENDGFYACDESGQIMACEKSQRMVCEKTQPVICAPPPSCCSPCKFRARTCLNNKPIELKFKCSDADLVVNQYADQAGKVYVAFPDKKNCQTYLFSVPEKMEETQPRIVDKKRRNDRSRSRRTPDYSRERDIDTKVQLPVSCKPSIKLIQTTSRDLVPYRLSDDYCEEFPRPRDICPGTWVYYA